YVVPTGRVVVPTGRYVVPTGRVVVPASSVIIVSSGLGTIFLPCKMNQRWSLDDLKYSVPTSGSYQTDPYPDDIKNYVQEERDSLVARIRHKIAVDVEDNQILTHEIVSFMKSWVEIIRENVFCLEGNRDHVLACLCYMLCCIAKSKPYNLAYFITKRMEFVTKQPWLILPYGMLLIRLFKYVMGECPESSNERSVLHDRVMYPLTAQQE
nr:pentatricopeptide repeat-containing protein [Tanacetum cinerariifolium]